MIKIKDYTSGQVLFYNDTVHSFYIKDGEAELFNADTQDKAEAKLDKYIKSLANTRCPVKVIDTNMKLFTITSYIADENKVWTRSEEAARYSEIGTRSKGNLIGYSNVYYYFEATDENMGLKNKHKELQAKIYELQEEAQKLIKQLEKPITPEYFKES